MSVLKKLWRSVMMLFSGCAPAPDVPEIRLEKESDDYDGDFYEYYLASNMPVKHDIFVYIQGKTWTVFNTDPPWETTYEMIPAGQMRSSCNLVPDGHRVRILPAEEREGHSTPILIGLPDGGFRIPDEIPLEESANYLANVISRSEFKEVHDLHPYKIGEPSEIEFPVSASHMELYRKMTDD